MGNGLSLQFPRTTGSSSEHLVDLEDVEENGYSKENAELYSMATKAIQEGSDVIELLEGYTSCHDCIREAISHPNDEHLYTELMAKLKPNISLTSKFYILATELEFIIPKLLMALIPHGAFKQEQALVKRLADIFVYMVTLDNLKIANPGIQNDFSYYRRCVTRKQNPDDAIVPDAEANMISLFIAEPSPMTRCIIKVTQNIYREETAILGIIASIANISCTIVAQKSYKSEAGMLHCLKAMTGAIILYDHISAVGVFRAKSDVKAKRCIKELRHTQNSSACGQLLNCIKYSSKNYNDSPSSIKALFA